MPIVVVPFDATRYGLPADADAWKLELDADDVLALAGQGWADLSLIVVGTLPADGGDVLPVTEVISGVIPKDWVPLDIVFVEARLGGLSGSLRWSWRPEAGERLDLLHIEHMTVANINRLRRAGNVIDVARARIGRPPGVADYLPGESAPKLAETVKTLWRNWGTKLDQQIVADELGISRVTLQKYLKRDGIRWPSVKGGNWPPR